MVAPAMLVESSEFLGKSSIFSQNSIAFGHFMRMLSFPIAESANQMNLYSACDAYLKALRNNDSSAFASAIAAFI